MAPGCRRSALGNRSVQLRLARITTGKYAGIDTRKQTVVLELESNAVRSALARSWLEAIEVESRLSGCHGGSRGVLCHVKYVVDASCKRNHTLKIVALT